MWRRRISLRTSASDECFLESFLDNVFGILPNACVAERNPKNLSLLALDQDFKRRFISTLAAATSCFSET